MSTIKYPKTPHLSYSPGHHKDDRQWKNESTLAGKEVVVTAKLDGENTTLYTNAIHARSLSSAHHPSREWVKRFHGNLAFHIPETMRICGENVYAHHSIYYRELPHYFMVFNIFEDGVCLSWDSVISWCGLFNSVLESESKQYGTPWNPLNGLMTVPVLYRGIYDRDAIHDVLTRPAPYGGCLLNPDGSIGEEAQEGYVIRLAEAYPEADFKQNVAKWVRKDHVQTGEHWSMRPVVQNILKK